MSDNAARDSAIAKNILEEFRGLTEHGVVWERGERCWQFRDPADMASRQAD